MYAAALVAFATISGNGHRRLGRCVLNSVAPGAAAVAAFAPLDRLLAHIHTFKKMDDEIDLRSIRLNFPCEVSRDRSAAARRGLSVAWYAASKSLIRI
ncbi:MAG TPA: hypothetical protein VKW08_11090 [Xanthobacteraceae bacterium]|nr:hypothetical protein [Xanthobacteraceae bacterium]